jgi:hypothetical protein
MVWAMGLAALVPATAATLAAGDLIKASGPAVYYYAADGQRYTFPTESTFMSWYDNFDTVKTITDDELAAIDLAGNVVVRSGTNLVKISTVPKVYAVEPNGTLVWLKTAAAAEALYGADWESNLIIIPDGFWTNYTDAGAELDGTAYPDGQLVKLAAGADTYYVNADGTWSKVATEAAFTANMWSWDDVVTAPASMTMTAGAEITAAMYTDVSQGGGAGSVATPTGSGTLTVALAGDTPVSSPVADNANANFTKFGLTATGAAVEVSRIVVTKGGYSSTGDVENIKITNLSGVGLSNTASLNSAGTAALTFNPAISLAAGETVYYYVRAGVVNSTTAGKTISYSVAASSDITSTASTVAGNFPVAGNALNVVQVAIGSATVYQDGTVTDTTPDAGDTDVTLNTFRIEAGTTEAITVESLTMLEIGTAGLTDIANIELWSVTENKSLGEVAGWTADGKASFSDLNLVIGKGDIYRFKVRADIVSGAGLTINADLIDGSDVLMSVKGNSFGFFITPSDGANWGGNTGEGANNQTINSGALIVTKSAATPATGNVTEASDQVFTTWDIEAQGEPVRVSAFQADFNVLGTDADGADLISCKLYDPAGTLVAGPVDGTDALDYVNFTDTFIVPVGVNQYTIKCRVFDSEPDDWANGATFAIGVTPSTGITAKGYSTNDSITPSPATAVNGNTMTLSSATLSATTLGSPAAKSVAVNTQDMIWSTFSLNAANSGEAISVTALVLEDTLGDAGDDANKIDNVEIWCDIDSSNSSRGDAYELKASGTEQFTDSAAADETLSISLTETITVAKNAYVRCAVIADLGSGATAGDTHTISLDTDSGDVTATGATTGGTVTVTPTGAGQTMTVAAAGTLTTSVDSSSPKAAIFVGGETAQTLGVFRLAANAVEDLDLDDLMITDDGAAGNDLVNTYYFYSSARADGGSTSDPIATAVGGATATVYFTDGTVSVPANGYVLITVKADFNVVDGTSVVNADAIEMTIAAGATDVATTGLSSGTAVVGSGTNYDAATHTLYEARPVVTKDSSSPSGTLGTGANTLVAVFRIDNSDGTDDITFENADSDLMVFQIAPNATGSAGTATSNLIIKDKSGTILDTIVVDHDDAAGEATLDFSTTDLTIPAGDYELIKVYADTTGYTTAGDSLQVYLDAVAGDITWGIGGAGAFATGVVTLRGGVYGNSLGK